MRLAHSRLPWCCLTRHGLAAHVVDTTSSALGATRSVLRESCTGAVGRCLCTFFADRWDWWRSRCCMQAYERLRSELL
ncbi:hypothetical protein B0H14DRAFT_3058804 [Mycena olivaceomarginata]|nr:hypothetical protein B0H14DRAFT_3058804 [Mycena olivaceomarginata]